MSSGVCFFVGFRTYERVEEILRPIALPRRILRVELLLEATTTATPCKILHDTGDAPIQGVPHPGTMAPFMRLQDAGPHGRNSWWRDFRRGEERIRQCLGTTKRAEAFMYVLSEG